MPVDSQLLDLVAMFRHMGLRTTASCSGHAGDGPFAPYVLFKSQASADEEPLIYDVEVDEKISQEARSRSIKSQSQNFSRLHRALAKFYSTRDVDYGLLMMVQSLPPGLNNLTFSSAGQLGLLGQAEQKRELALMWKEIDRFYKFLVFNHADL